MKEVKLNFGVEDQSISLDNLLLVCGDTGSGKSVSLNTILSNLIKDYTAEDLRINLLDFKGCEEVESDDLLIRRGKDDCNSRLNYLPKHLDSIIGFLRHSECNTVDEYNEKVIDDHLRSTLVIVYETDWNSPELYNLLRYIHGFGRITNYKAVVFSQSIPSENTYLLDLFTQRLVLKSDYDLQEKLLGSTYDIKVGQAIYKNTKTGNIQHLQLK